MSQKNNKDLTVDQTAELAFEELLELSTMELEPTKKTKKAIKTKSYLNIDENESLGQNDLFNIINNVKQQNNDFKGWVDPNKEEEENIIIKAKAAGKSEYDSDVLRELILKRQKERRADKAGFGNLLSNVRQKKEDYNK